MKSKEMCDGWDMHLIKLILQVIISNKCCTLPTNLLKREKPMFVNPLKSKLNRKEKKKSKILSD